MLLALAVGGAGAVGAVARYLLDATVQEHTSGMLPVGTITVNLVGSFVLGLVAGVALHRGGGAGIAAVVVGTGFCGGFTTWSTAAWETVRLGEEGAASHALVNLLGGVLGSLGVAAIGLAITANL